MMILDTTK